MRLKMGRINIELPEDVHNSIRYLAIDERRSIKDMIVLLIKNSLNLNNKRINPEKLEINTNEGN